MFASTIFLSLVAAAAAACDGTTPKNNTGAVSPGAKAQCALQFDGRIPKTFKAADFDSTSSPFNTANVFGKGLKFSEIVQLPGGNSLVRYNLKAKQSGTRLGTPDCLLRIVLLT